MSTTEPAITTVLGSIQLALHHDRVRGWLLYDLPGIERLESATRRPSVTLLAADGSMLASYGDLYGQAVTVDNLPPYLTQAIVATEDRRFYDHFGIDLRGLARAMYVNISEWRLVQGGSTITQQLAKIAFLTPERSYGRKIKEALLALRLERRFSKDELLSIYLTRAYFGGGVYGIDAAARRYFGRPASALTLYQAAMLAGVLEKHGLKARVIESEEVSAGNVVSLDSSKAKLIFVSALGTSASQIRYLVRRLRRILPEGATIAIGCWAEEKGSSGYKALVATAEADAYATSIREAAEICVSAARGDTPLEGTQTAARVA